MKKTLTTLFLALGLTLTSFSQVDCAQVKSDSCRIRIVTLAQPKNWQTIPVPYIVEPEGDNFVFYSDRYGNYCDMLIYMAIAFSNSVYAPKVVVCRPKTTK